MRMFAGSGGLFIVAIVIENKGSGVEKFGWKGVNLRRRGSMTSNEFSEPIRLD
jgi:hypothetical protein